MRPRRGNRTIGTDAISSLPNVVRRLRIPSSGSAKPLPAIGSRSVGLLARRAFGADLEDLQTRIDVTGRHPPLPTDLAARNRACPKLRGQPPLGYPADALGRLGQVKSQTVMHDKPFQKSNVARHTSYRSVLLRVRRRHADGVCPSYAPNKSSSVRFVSMHNRAVQSISINSSHFQYISVQPSLLRADRVIRLQRAVYAQHQTRPTTGTRRQTRHRALNPDHLHHGHPIVRRPRHPESQRHRAGGAPR